MTEDVAPRRSTRERKTVVTNADTEDRPVKKRGRVAKDEDDGDFDGPKKKKAAKKRAPKKKKDDDDEDGADDDEGDEVTTPAEPKKRGPPKERKAAGEGAKKEKKEKKEKEEKTYEAGPDGKPSAEQNKALNEAKADKLKELLKNHEKPTSGSKKDLIKRITESIQAGTWKHADGEVI